MTYSLHACVIIELFLKLISYVRRMIQDMDRSETQVQIDDE